MKNLSLFQIALISIFLFVAGAGLVAFVTFQGTKTSTPNLTIWTDIEVDGVEAYLRSGLDDGTKIDVEKFRSSTFVDDVISEFSLNNYPDIILTNSNNQLSLGKRLKEIPFESLTESHFRATYVSGANNAFKTETGYYGIPLALDPLIMYSNDVEMSKLGIALPPKYWDEVSSIVNSYSKRSGNEVVQVIFPLGLADNVVAAQDIFSTLLGQVGLTPLVRSSSGYASNVSNDDATQILNYYTDFANPNSGVYNWNPNFKNSTNTFVTGESTFYIDYASRADDLSDLNPNIAISYSEVPQIRSNNPYVHAQFYGFYFPVASKTTAAAVTYATQLASDDDFKELLNASNMVSAVRSQVNTRENKPALAAASKSSLYAGNWPQRDVEQSEFLFSQLIDDVQFRGTGPSKALSEYGNKLKSL